MSAEHMLQTSMFGHTARLKAFPYNCTDRQNSRVVQTPYGRRITFCDLTLATRITSDLRRAGWLAGAGLCPLSGWGCCCVSEEVPTDTQAAKGHRLLLSGIITVNCKGLLITASVVGWEEEQDGRYGHQSPRLKSDANTGNLLLTWSSGGNMEGWETESIDIYIYIYIRSLSITGN